MFDIKFFQNTYALKKEIVSGIWKAGDSEQIYEKLECHRDPNPHLFSIETTNNCNMTCVMCPRTTEMTRKIETMKPEIFDRVVEQISPHTNDSFDAWRAFIEREFGITKNEKGENPFYFLISSRAVTLHGFGEPLFDPLLRERVQKLADKLIPTYFSCNPSNININKIEALFRAGLTYIKFSIDSLSDEKMKTVRGRQADFTGAMSKIERVLDMRNTGKYPVTVIACMIQIQSNHEAQEFIRMWKDRDVYAYVKSLDNQWYLNNPVRERARSHYESQYCEFPWTSLSVMADGTVVPCTQDFNCEMKMGNVMHQSLGDIWNSAKYAEFRRMHITGDVPDEYRCKERCDLKIVADYLRKNTLSRAVRS